MSSLSPVLSGVTQGSILGPILFLVYINDLPLEVTFSKLFLFADNGKCTLPLRVSSDSLKLQQDIDVLNKWCNTWNMHFNFEKFTLLSFFSRFNSTYTINDLPIVSKTSHKDLGVVITSDLKWNAHLEFILSKAYKVLHLLRRTFNTTNSITTKKFLYLCLIRSRVSYCSPIWRPFLLKNIKLLEDLQRRATKFILQDFTISLVSYVSEFFFLKQLKRPIPGFNILDFVTFTTSKTRSSSSNKLKHTFSHTSSSHHFYFNRLPRIWNALPFIDLNQSLTTIKSTILLESFLKLL